MRFLAKKREFCSTQRENMCESSAADIHKAGCMESTATQRPLEYPEYSSAEHLKNAKTPEDFAKLGNP